MNLNLQRQAVELVTGLWRLCGWECSELFAEVSFHTFIHSRYFYSASSSPLLLRGAPDAAQILCQSFMLKRHRQLQVKNLPKVPTWRIERDSNPRPFEWKVMSRPLQRISGAHAMEYFGASGNLKTIKLLINHLFSVHQWKIFLTFVSKIVNNIGKV